MKRGVITMFENYATECTFCGPVPAVRSFAVLCGV